MNTLVVFMLAVGACLVAASVHTRRAKARRSESGVFGGDAGFGDSAADCGDGGGGD